MGAKSNSESLKEKWIQKYSSDSESVHGDTGDKLGYFTPFVAKPDFQSLPKGYTFLTI
jgi:hypothetical protein